LRGDKKTPRGGTCGCGETKADKDRVGNGLRLQLRGKKKIEKKRPQGKKRGDIRGERDYYGPGGGKSHSEKKD